MSAALAIFVKTPGHSPLKTRLAADVGEAAALAFHELAACAVAEVACAVEADLHVYWAVAEVAALDDPRWAALPRLWQGTGGLGERMHHVHEWLLRRHDRVVLVGADAPQIAPQHVHEALRVLDRQPSAVVLGEAADGGFWLFASRTPVPLRIWRSVAYSRPDTAEQLCRALGSRQVARSLPVLTDVDRVSDLATVADELSALSTPLPGQSAVLEWMRRVNARSRS